MLRRYYIKALLYIYPIVYICAIIYICDFIHIKALLYICTAKKPVYCMPRYYPKPTGYVHVAVCSIGRYSGSIEALIRRYSGSIKALFRLY